MSDIHWTNLVRPCIIMYAAVVHVVWGTSLLFWPETAWATAVHGLTTIFGHGLLSPALLLAAGLAAAMSVVFETPRRFAWSTGLAIPQQALLIISAAECFMAAWAGQYADGVQRPQAFVFADQFPSMLLAVFHTIVLVRAPNHH